MIPYCLQPCLAQVEAIAVRENRSTSDVVCEVVEQFLRGRHEVDNLEQAVSPPLTPQEAAKLMLERRRLQKLPDGGTIRDLMVYGRL